MRHVVISAVLALALALAGAGDALAKAGSTSKSSGGSLGSRGSRTQDAPMERTLMLPPAQHSTTPAGPPPPPKAVPKSGNVEATPLSPTGTPMAPGVAPATMGAPVGAMGMPAAQPGFFQRNPFMAGLAGGLLGTGIGSMLFGSSAMAGPASPGAGILGLMLQILAIGVLVWLAWRLFRGNPATAEGGKGNPYLHAASRSRTEPKSGPSGANPYMSAAPRERAEAPAPAASGRGGNPYMPAVPAGHVEPVIAAAPAQPRIDKEFDPSRGDQDTFTEILLGVQKAWSDGNLAQMRRYATAEVVSFLSDDLSRNASEGIVNRVENVALVKGDVTESWSEDGFDYLTAILVFSCNDYMVSVDSGEVVQGNPRATVTHTEAWTFVRSSKGGRWLVSAVQQVP